jgi:hypothetical protein
MNEGINELEALLQEAHREPMGDVRAVGQFEGIWLSRQTQQAGFKEDSRKRKRPQKQGKRMVVLVALGLWTDGSGKRHILDWEGAEQERPPGNDWCSACGSAE